MLNTLIEEGFFINKELRNRTDVNKETGMVVETNKSGIYETFNFDNYSRRGKFAKVAKLATVRMLPQIITDGKVVNDNVSNSHKNSNNKQFAYIEQAVKIGDKEVVVKIGIKKSPQKNKFWVHQIYTTESAGVSLASAENSTEASYITTDTNSSVTELQSAVKKNIETNVEEKSFLSLDDYVDDDSYERVLKRKNSALQEETESQFYAIHQLYRDGDITEDEMIAAENDVINTLFKRVNKQTHDYVKMRRDRDNQRAKAKRTRSDVKDEVRGEMAQAERKRVLRDSIRRRADSFGKRLSANTNTRNIPENLKPVTQAFVKLVYANNFEKDNLNNLKVIVN